MSAARARPPPSPAGPPHRAASSASSLHSADRPPPSPSRRAWNQASPSRPPASPSRFAGRAGSPAPTVPKRPGSASASAPPSPAKQVGVRAARSAQYQHALRARYEEVLGGTHRTEREWRDGMRALRALVLSDGLPEAAEDGNRCGLRGRVWKALLGVQRISAAEYVTLLERKECDAHDKIRNDAFRTLATDKRFTERVGENVLLRVLNAFVWKSRDFAVSRLSPLSFTYVQGMNVLAAPFLFVMPELDAFYSFATFIRDACPLYVQPSLEGAHCAMKLLDICLFTLDPELYAHLRSKGLEAKVYAMAPILTFCACIQPLDEVLVLWDFLLAYGVHLNVLAVVAQLEFFRDELLRSDSPMKHLRSLPPLRGRATIDAIVNRLLPRVPDSLYDMLARHPWDAAVYTVLQTVDGGSSPGGDGLSMGAAELLGCFEVF